MFFSEEATRRTTAPTIESGTYHCRPFEELAHIRGRGSIVFHLLLFLSLTLQANLMAQIRQHKFGRITVEDGLSSFRVYDVAQDGKGFLWIATLDGLDRYDGYTFKVYRHDDRDSTSLSHNMITRLYVDRSGTLWAGTFDGGLNRFNPITEQFIHYLNDPADSLSISGGQITSIYEDNSATLWIGTHGKGLNKLVRSSAGISVSDSGHPQSGNNESTKERVTFVRYRHDNANPNGLSDDRVNAIVEDNSGTLWVGTDEGLSALDRKKEIFTHYKHRRNDPHSLSNNFVKAIHQDMRGTLWMATQGGGLNRFDRTTGQFTHYRHESNNPTSISSDDISSIYEDGSGSLWIGTFDKGLDKFDRRTGHFTHYRNDPTNPSSLVYDLVRAIRGDKSGLIWIVTDRGLSKMNRRTDQFIHYRHDSDILAPQSVSALHESAGTLWIGTEAGLKKINTKTGTLTHYRHDPRVPTSLSSDDISVILEDKSGILWIGNFQGILDMLDKKTDRFVHYTWDSKDLSGYIVTICEGRSGILWIGTARDGLVRFDTRKKQFDSFKNDPEDPHSLSNNTVSAILEDRSYTLWLGTEGGGLNRFDQAKGKFRPYRHDPSNPNSLSHDRVYALCEDRSGRLWAATGNGLNLFDRERESFKRFIGADSMATGNIISIIEDDNGHLWLSTLQNGIFRFEPGTETFQNYDVNDGLQSNQFWYAAFKRKNGEILFGGENGFNVFHPDSIRDNTFQPPVVLTAFRIFDKPLQTDTSLSEIKEIRLAYDQNFFTFEFAALDFTLPGKNQYAYKLERLDKDWVLPQNRGFGVYTDVDPGEYALRIRGSNNDGIWNDAGLSIPLIITPPFWATWWFRGLMAAVLVGLLAAAYNYRVTNLLKIERMRLRIASDLHDDIGSSLGSIALISDMIHRRAQLGETESKQLSEITRSARHTAEALRDIVWVINPEHDKVDNLVLRMKDAAGTMLRNIEYSFHCDSEKVGEVLDMEFRRNILLIYKEILHNILKHANASRVDIVLQEEHENLTLTITDNGVGFDPSVAHKGNGLKNLQYRAGKLAGQLEIKSSPGKGASFGLTAKIP